MPALPDAEPVAVVQQWNDFAGDSTTTAVRHHVLKLKPETIKPGQTVLIRAVAWDRRAISDWGLDLGAQEGASGWHAVKIVAEDGASRRCPGTTGQAARHDLEDFGEADPRPQGGRCAPALEQLAERSGGAAEIRTQQVDIQKTIGRLGPVDRRDRPARSGWPSSGSLNGLAFGDMLQAVTRCETLVKLKAPDDFNKPVPPIDCLAGPDHRRAAEAAGRDAAGPGRRAGRDEEAARQQPARRREAEARGDCTTSSTSSSSSRRR